MSSGVQASELGLQQMALPSVLVPGTTLPVQIGSPAGTPHTDTPRSKVHNLPLSFAATGHAGRAWCEIDMTEDVAACTPVQAVHMHRREAH